MTGVIQWASCIVFTLTTLRGKSGLRIATDEEESEKAGIPQKVTINAGKGGWWSVVVVDTYDVGKGFAAFQLGSPSFALGQMRVLDSRHDSSPKATGFRPEF